MSVLVVGIGDCRVTKVPGQNLITYALGSCVALVAHDLAHTVGGMLHVMLPEASMDMERAFRNPFLFADSGTPSFLRWLYALGACKEHLEITLAGGSQFVHSKGVSNIGKRNCCAARGILSREGLSIARENVGGALFRSIRLEVGSGKVFLRLGGKDEQELFANGSHHL